MSVAADLFAAVKAALEAALPGYTVVARKQPARVQNDPDRLAVVSLGPDRREAATGEDDWAWAGYYPVSVFLSSPQAAPLGTGGTLLADREAAVRAATDLQGLSAAVPVLDGVEYQGKPFFGAGAAAKGLDLEAFGVTFRTAEPR